MAISKDVSQSTDRWSRRRTALRRRRAGRPSRNDSARLRSCPMPVVAAGWWRPRLVKAYRGRPVVREASLAVARGEAVGLLGSDGAARRRRIYIEDAGLVYASAAPSRSMATT